MFYKNENNKIITKAIAEIIYIKIKTSFIMIISLFQFYLAY